MPLSFLKSGSEFELKLGDPSDPSGPLSYARSLESDEDESFPDHAVEALDRLGLPEHYIPSDKLGGRLERVDSLLYVLRALARHDLTATIAHAKTLLGAVPVWVAGDTGQGRRCATLIRSGHCVALGLTEQAHGGDLVACETTLEPLDDGRFRLSGEKWLINNGTRSAALTVYANLAGVKGPAAGSLVWVEKALAGEASCSHPTKLRTHGIRAADISGVSFSGVLVSGQDFIGGQGKGLSVILRSLQVSRTLCCGLSLGAGDLAVRTQALFLDKRRLYGRTLAEHPHLRHGLASAFASQLAAECLSLTACRLMHVRPAEMAVESSLAKYLVPELVEGVFERGEKTLGARAYLRDSPWAHFQKTKRDQQLVSLFDGSSVVNLGVLTLNLRRILERLVPGVPPDAESLQEEAALVFDLSRDLPRLDFQSLAVAGRGEDIPLRFLGLFHAHGRTAGLDAALGAKVELLVGEVASLREKVLKDFKDLHFSDPDYFDAAKRYAALHAAAACFFMWWFNQEATGTDYDPEFRNPAWLVQTLGRLLLGRLDANAGNEVADWALRLAREERALSFLPFACPHKGIPDAVNLVREGLRPEVAPA